MQHAENVVVHGKSSYTEKDGWIHKIVAETPDGVMFEIIDDTDEVLVTAQAEMEVGIAAEVWREYKMGTTEFRVGQSNRLHVSYTNGVYDGGFPAGLSEVMIYMGNGEDFSHIELG